MKLLLLRACRIRHNAGETVEVSPDEAGFLLSTGSAVIAQETAAGTGIQETAPQRETPETLRKAARVTRKK